MTIGIPQIGDSVPWNEIPECFNSFGEDQQPEDGTVTGVDLTHGWVYVEVTSWDGEGYNTENLTFHLDGSSWDVTGEWKYEWQWGYQREQVNQEQDDEVLDGFAQMG